MQSYWMGSVDPANYEIIKEKSIWGVSSTYKKSLERTSKGDKIIFYLHGKKLGGIFQIVSDVYQKSGKFEGGTYPYIVDLEAVRVLDKEGKLPDFDEKLREKLGFIENKNYWSAYFRNPMTEIPEEDYKILREALG